MLSSSENSKSSSLVNSLLKIQSSNSSLTASNLVTQLLNSNSVFNNHLLLPELSHYENCEIKKPRLLLNTKSSFQLQKSSYESQINSIATKLSAKIQINSTLLHKPSLVSNLTSSNFTSHLRTLVTSKPSCCLVTDTQSQHQLTILQKVKIKIKIC